MRKDKIQKIMIAFLPLVHSLGITVIDAKYKNLYFVFVTVYMTVIIYFSLHKKINTRMKLEVVMCTSLWVSSFVIYFFHNVFTARLILGIGFAIWLISLFFPKAELKNKIE